jgi:flagellar biosynthesis/type III secretory pathway M-ring protein FliF/YscJ
MRSELEAYKQQLEQSARSKVSQKDQVATEEVRNFAKDNPQITAELLRSWLKGDEQ